MWPKPQHKRWLRVPMPSALTSFGCSLVLTRQTAYHALAGIWDKRLPASGIGRSWRRRWPAPIDSRWRELRGTLHASWEVPEIIPALAL